MKNVWLCECVLSVYFLESLINLVLKLWIKVFYGLEVCLFRDYGLYFMEFNIFFSYIRM